MGCINALSRPQSLAAHCMVHQNCTSSTLQAAKYPTATAPLIILQSKKQIIQGIKAAKVNQCGDFLTTLQNSCPCPPPLKHDILGSVGRQYVAFLQAACNQLASTFSTAHLPAAAGRVEWRVATQVDLCKSAKVQDGS